MATPTLSFDELKEKAQHSLLTTPEALTLLTSYERHGEITREQPQEMPPSGTIFVVPMKERDVFKNDGYNWIKEKNGDRPKESYVLLRIEKESVLEYRGARLQENEDFIRRVYTAPSELVSDMALFHYIEDTTTRKRKRHGKEIVGDPSQDAPADTKTVRTRFEELLCVQPVNQNCNSITGIIGIIGIHLKLKPLLEDDEEIIRVLLEQQTSSEIEIVEEKFYQKYLKKKLHLWLFHKLMEGKYIIAESGCGGLGALHFAAALGYNWALKAIIIASGGDIDINSPDAKEWTPLHWAAHFGRMETAVFLISKGAAIALASETRPADVAGAAGHKEVSDYLEEQEKIFVASLPSNLNIS